MLLTRTELDQALARIEALVPALLKDRNAFPRLFEDEVETLLGQVRAADQDYALEQLDAIVERSGFNR